MTRPGSDSIAPETPFIPMMRSLRTAAIADACLARSPRLWLAGLGPLVRSVEVPEQGWPAWMQEVLAKTNVLPAFVGGPALILARAAMEDLGQTILDLRRAATQATPKETPHLLDTENRALAKVCSEAHVEALKIFDALEGPVLQILSAAKRRAEDDTQPAAR